MECYDFVCDHCEGKRVADGAPAIARAKEAVRIASLEIDAAKFRALRVLVDTGADIKTVRDVVND